MKQCMEKLHTGHQRGSGDEGKRKIRMPRGHNTNVTQILDGSAQQEHYTTKAKLPTHGVSSSDQFSRQRTSPQTSHKVTRTEKPPPQIKHKELHPVHELKQTVQKSPYPTQSTLHLEQKSSHPVEKPMRPIQSTPYPRKRQEHLPLQETTQPADKLTYSTGKSCHVRESSKSSQVTKHSKHKQSHQTEKLIQPFQKQSAQAPPQPTQYQTRQALKQALYQSVENANHKQNPIKPVLYVSGPNHQAIPAEKPRKFTESNESKQSFRNPPHYTKKKPKKMQKSQPPYDRQQLEKPRLSSESEQNAQTAASLVLRLHEMKLSHSKEHGAQSEHLKQLTDQKLKSEHSGQRTLGPVQHQLNSPKPKQLIQHAIKQAHPKHQTTISMQSTEHSLEPHYPRQDTSKRAQRIQYEQNSTQANQHIPISANSTQSTPKSKQPMEQQPIKAQLAQVSKPEEFTQCRSTEKGVYLQQNLSEPTETPLKPEPKSLQATEKSREALQKPPYIHSHIITRSSSEEHKQQAKHSQQLQNKEKYPENYKMTGKICRQRELHRSRKPQNMLQTQHSILAQHSMVQQSVYMVNLQETHKTEDIQEQVSDSHYVTSPSNAVHLTDYIKGTTSTSSDTSDTSDDEQIISETVIQPTDTSDLNVMQLEQETATITFHKLKKNKTRRSRTHKRKTEPTRDTKATEESTQPCTTVSQCTYPHYSKEEAREKKKEISNAEGKGKQEISNRTANQTDKITKTNKQTSQNVKTVRPFETPIGSQHLLISDPDHIKKQDQHTIKMSTSTKHTTKSHDPKEKVSVTPMDIPRSMEGKPQTRGLLQTVKASKSTANDGWKRLHNTETANPLHKTTHTKTIFKSTSKKNDEKTGTPIVQEKPLKTVTGPQPNLVSPGKQSNDTENNSDRTKNTQSLIISATSYEGPTKPTCNPSTNIKKDFKSKTKTKDAVSIHQNEIITEEEKILPEQPSKILSKMLPGKEIHPGKTRNLSMTPEKEENLCHTISDLVSPYMTLPKQKSAQVPTLQEKTKKFPDTLEKNSRMENLSERARNMSPKMRKTEKLTQHQEQALNIREETKIAPWNMTPRAGLKQSRSSLQTPVSSLESSISHTHKESYMPVSQCYDAQKYTNKNEDQHSTFSGQSDYLRNLKKGDERDRQSSTLYLRNCPADEMNTSGDQDQVHHVSSLYSNSHQKCGKDYIIDISWFKMYIYFSQRQKLELMFKRYETKQHQLMKHTDKLARTVNIPVNSENLISRVKKLIQLKETQKNLLEAVEGEEKENNQHLEELTKQLQNVKAERMKLISDREMMQREINLTRKATFNLDARRCYQGFMSTQRQMHKGEYLHRYNNSLRLKMCKADEAIKSKLKTLQSLQESHEDATLKKKELNRITKRVSKKVKVVKKKIHKLQCLHNNINTTRQKEHSIKRFKELADNLQLQAEKLKGLTSVLQTVPVERHSHIPSLVNALTDEEKRIISWSVSNQSLHQEPKEGRQDASRRYQLVASDVWSVSASVPKHKPQKTSTEPWTVEPLDAVQRYVAIRVKGHDLWTITDSRTDTGSG